MNDGAGHYGFFSGGASTLNLTNITIVGGSEVTGGAISLTGALTENGDLAVSNNIATNGSGGAIAVTTGGVSVNGGLVANSNTSGIVSPNTLIKGGGAISVAAGDVIMSGSTSMNANTTTAVNTITGAGAGPGGAIYAANGNVRLATADGNVILTNNVSSSSGGAIFAAGSAASNVSLGAAGSTLTITANRAGFTPGGAQVPGTSSGGAISNTAGTTTLFGDTILFANNQATSNGGAIASAKVVATGNVTAISNTLTGGNGGFINAGTGGVSVTGTLTANNNIGATSGGVIFTTGPVLVTGSVSLDSNIAASVFAGQGNGGAIATTGAASNVSLAATSGDVSITNNKGSWSGGGIIAGGNLVIGNSSSQVNITGNMGGYNADGTQLAGSIAFGGALRVFGTIILNGASINVSGNTASANGGGIYSNSSVTVNGPLVANNNLSAFGVGGGIYSLAGDVTTNADVSMSGNVAGSGNGGAILVNNGNTVISTTSGNVSLTNNTASLDGGAISAAGSGNVTVGNAAATVTLSGNKAGFDATGAPVNATSRGGAIFAAGVTTITGVANTISNNQATLDGGGVYSVSALTLNAGGPTALNGNIAGANGGAIWGGSNVTLNAIGGDITFSGNLQNGTQANAIYLNNTGGATTTTFYAATGRTLTFFDPVQSNAANGLVSVIVTGAGTVAFDGSRDTAPANRWSQVYGATQVQAGRFVVNNDAVYGVLAADVGQTEPSSFVVSPGATLAGGVAGTARADAITLGGTLDIAGTAAGTVGNLFTLTNNSVSFNAGSRVLFNTFLGSDNSPSDRLIINGGAATGTSSIFITNIGGSGALTLANGIPVVQAVGGGTTAPGTFQLGGLVTAGPFDYRLFRGGVAGTNPDDWFLRSDFIVPPLPNPPPAPSFDPFPPHPPPDPLPPRQIFPIVDPRLATYGVVQPIARQLGLSMLGTLHERIGDTLSDGNTAGGLTPSAWGRVIGQQIDNRYEAFADPRASGRLIGLQAGFDVWRDGTSSGHRDAAGLYFAYANANADVDGLVSNAATTAYVLQRTGTLNLNAYSLGGYWTHYGPGGWYLDAILQGTHYDGDAQAQFTQSSTIQGTTFGSKLQTQGSGVLASLEAGYPLPVPRFGPNFIIEPQAQIIWQRVNFDSANDGVDNVSLGSTSGATGRLGLRGQWSIPSDRGTLWQPYGGVNLWHDWGGDASTGFSGSNIAVPLLEEATRLEFMAGVTFRHNANLSFFAQAGYQSAVSPNDAKRDGVKGDIGLRYTW